MNIRRLIAIVLVSFMLTSLFACDASDSSRSDLSEIKTSKNEGEKPLIEQEVNTAINRPSIEQLSDSQLESIYQILNKFDGCIDSPLPIDVEQACQSIGGTMQPEGMSGCYRCTQHYSDGGKVCTDGSDCQGDCKGWIDDERVENNKFTGECAYDDSIFGCYTIIEKGQQISGSCID